MMSDHRSIRAPSDSFGNVAVLLRWMAEMAEMNSRAGDPTYSRSSAKPKSFSQAARQPGILKTNP